MELIPIPGEDTDIWGLAQQGVKMINDANDAFEKVYETLGYMRAFSTMNDVKPGTPAYIKYSGFWHAILITEKDPDRNAVKAVHFAWPSVLQRRVIQEDEFEVNLSEKELYEILIPANQRVSAEEAVRRARELIGQKGFNALWRRSSHVVRECVMKS